MRQVTVAYCLTTVLSPLLSLLNLFSSTPRPILVTALSTYFECAAYFALAIQLASIVTMASKDSFLVGGQDRQTAGIASVVATLPLLGPLWVLPLRQRERRWQRLIFALFVVLLSVYPFASYSGSANLHKIDGLMTDEEAGALGRLCPSGAIVAKDGDLAFLCRLFGFLWSCILTIIATFPLCFCSIPSPFRKGRVEVWTRVRCCFPMAVTACLGIALVYALLRQRGLQSAMAGEYYALNEWGYGQVMAITVFAPVGVEMLFGWWFGGKKMDEVADVAAPEGTVLVSMERVNVDATN